MARETGLTKKGFLLGIFILMLAIIPSSLQPLITAPPFYASLIDFTIVSFGIINYLLSLLRLVDFPVRYVVFLTILLLIQATFGVIDSPFLEEHEAASLIYPIFVLTFTPFCAFMLVNFAKSHPSDLILWLAWIVALIGIEYIAATIIGPMLGFRGGDTNTVSNRISGIIGNAATLQIILLPAFSVFLEVPQKRLSWLGALCCALGLLFTFSRASIVSLFIYLLYYLVLARTHTIGRKIVSLFLLSTMLIVFLQISDNPLIERLSPDIFFQDAARDKSWETAIAAWQDQPLFGQGFSHIWPIQKRQGELIAGLRLNRWDGLEITTPFGVSLWSPHSLIAYIGGEMGVVGLSIVGLIAIAYARQLLISSTWNGLAIALISSALLDSVTAGTFYFFPFNILIWWMLCICVIKDNKNTKPNNGL